MSTSFVFPTMVMMTKCWLLLLNLAVLAAAFTPSAFHRSAGTWPSRIVPKPRGFLAEDHQSSSFPRPGAGITQQPALRKYASATALLQQVPRSQGIHPKASSSSSSTTALDASSVAAFAPESLFRRPVGAARDAVRKLVNSLKHDEVSRWRAVFFTFFSSLIIFRKAVDAQLVVFWKHLMTSQSIAGRVFRSDSWEWGLAVASFLVWIHGFWYADRAVRKATEQGRVHPWRKFRLQDRFEADKHRRMLMTRKERHEGSVDGEIDTSSSVAALSSENGAAEGSEKIQPPATKQSEWNWQAWVFELWVYVLPLLTWDILAPRRHRRLAPFAAPTTLQILGGVAFGLVFYDFLFFCGHYLMHKIPPFFRFVHSKHHKVQEVRAGEIVRLSLVEEVLEVGFSIIALNLLSVHPLARSIYNVIITFLLTELHCGFDFPWTPQNVIPFGLATGSRRHHYHHRNGRHYYQKFFFTLDRLFGFFQKDDGSLHGDSVKPDPYIPKAWQQA